MKVETYKCDVCGKVKGEVNHWWIIRSAASKNIVGERFFSLVAWGERFLKAGMKGTFTGEIVDASESHLCGAECVQKKVSEFLSK